MLNRRQAAGQSVSESVVFGTETDVTVGASESNDSSPDTELEVRQALYNLARSAFEPNYGPDTEPEEGWALYNLNLALAAFGPDDSGPDDPVQSNHESE